MRSKPQGLSQANPKEKNMTLLSRIREIATAGEMLALTMAVTARSYDLKSAILDVNSKIATHPRNGNLKYAQECWMESIEEFNRTFPEYKVAL
jgi:hypothetical protein